MRFFIPAFARSDGHSFLLKVAAPPGMDERALGLVELRYKDRVAKRNVTEEIPFSIGYEVSDAASAVTADPSVARSIQGFAAGEALMEAADRIARRDRAGAVAVLAEREGILRAAAEELGEPLLRKDAERLSRLRSHMGSTAGVGNPLVLSMLLEAAGRTHLH
jgi:Ca-activated chloride channel family protein